MQNFNYTSGCRTKQTTCLLPISFTSDIPHLPDFSQVLYVSPQPNHLAFSSIPPLLSRFSFQIPRSLICIFFLQEAPLYHISVLLEDYFFANKRWPNSVIDGQREVKEVFSNCRGIIVYFF